MREFWEIHDIVSSSQLKLQYAISNDVVKN